MWIRRSRSRHYARRERIELVARVWPRFAWLGKCKKVVGFAIRVLLTLFTHRTRYSSEYIKTFTACCSSWEYKSWVLIWLLCLWPYWKTMLMLMMTLWGPHVHSHFFYAFFLLNEWKWKWIDILTQSSSKLWPGSGIAMYIYMGWMGKGKLHKPPSPFISISSKLQHETIYIERPEKGKERDIT